MLSKQMRLLSNQMRLLSNQTRVLSNQTWALSYRRALFREAKTIDGSATEGVAWQ